MTPGSDDALATHELDLVTRASKGDAEAFDRFYERNAGGVQLLVERLLGPGPVADTVVLEAFEKTVRRLPLLGARNSSPRLYVLTTARNGAYAALGRERPEAPQGPVAALLSLPSRQRELLALRELGLGEGECAEVAGIEPAEVGIQVARGRLRLTDALEEASLSGVFAEPRAERLLAAEVVRQEGASLPPELEQEITQLADSDARFAAALSAVRSPSRSVGQLPPATGASRLGAIARERIVLAGAGGAAAIAGAGAPAAAAPAPARPPARTSDPYDAEIGDEAAWGIVDDDDADDPAPAAPAPPADGPEPTGAPSDEAWGTGSPQPAGPSRVPASSAPDAAAAAAAGAGADAPLDDLAGWDALDWDEDDRQWTAGPDAAPTAVAPIPADDPTAGAPIAAAPVEGAPIDPDQTRAFDVVAAGLADPDDEAAVTSIAPGPPAGFDFGGGDNDEPEERERRSPWRFLLWLIGFALLFAGVAFAAYTWREARDNPDAPPASTIQPTTSTAPAGEEVAPTSGSSKRSSGSSESSKKSSSSSSSTKSTSGSSSSTSSGSTSNSSSGSTSSGSSGGSSSSGGASTGGGTSTGGSTTQDQTVSGGEETSGGSVRGDAGTTP